MSGYPGNYQHQHRPNQAAAPAHYQYAQQPVQQASPPPQYIQQYPQPLAYQYQQQQFQQQPQPYVQQQFQQQPYQQVQQQYYQPIPQQPVQPIASQYETVYHIYKSGMFSRDAKITDSNKNQVFHVEFPFAFFGAWSVTVHHGATKQGPIAMSINKPTFSWDFEIVDHGMNFRTILHKVGMFSRKHAFNGPNGKEFAWKGTGFGGDLKLVAYPEKVQVAYYDRAAFSFRKEGKIVVTPQVSHMANLIIATGFAVEEWEREERQKRHRR